MGHGQAQRPGGAQIHHEFDGGGQLHRQVPRLLAAQDADDIAGGAAEQVGQIGAIAEQGTGMAGAISAPRPRAARKSTTNSKCVGFSTGRWLTGVPLAARTTCRAARRNPSLISGP